MIPYIQYGPIMTAAAPIVCIGADLYVFAILADLKALNRLCKRVFDQPSGGAVKCRALDPYIILIFGAIKKVSGVVGGPGVKEKNVLLHVPVLVETADASFPALFSPFVWVDNPNSMTGGREVFGYAKTFGKIEINSSPEPVAFDLDTFGGNLNDQFWDMHPGLIRIKRKQQAPNPLVSIMDLVGGLGEVGYLLESWSGEGVTEIFHKQFRAISDRQKGNLAPACLHEIATADYGLFGPPAEIDPLTHLYEIKLKHLDSHPIVKELGLPPTSKSPGYRVRTNFKVEHGRVLWHG
ncbi:MAG TPA: acetoacetate decarboxylase family protein [Candidatus Binataceae bacterium]|nr:acetoacetate decarboxylase family protein [Candidatus Binataceae bacterium]